MLYQVWSSCVKEEVIPDIAIFVLKIDVKLQLTNCRRRQSGEQVVKVIVDKRLHCRLTRMVRSYLPDGPNVHHHLIMLRWAHPSPHPKWHVDQFSFFLHSLRQTVPILYNGLPVPPQNGPFAGGSGLPVNMWFPRSAVVHTPNHISIGSAILVGLTIMTD